MPEGTHTKCESCRGFGWTVEQTPHISCQGKGCSQCKEGKVPTQKRCEPCKGEGYVESKPFRISYQ